jgi:hypothetical protein
MAKTLYKCHNQSCSLGAVGQAGLFTGGITKEQVKILTGSEGPHGAGYCPNCGKKGKRG